MAADVQFELELWPEAAHLWWTHQCSTNFAAPGEPEDHTSRSRIPLDETEGWQVQQMEPLSVSPSLLCTVCGTHGYITNGEWIAV